MNTKTDINMQIVLQELNDHEKRYLLEQYGEEVDLANAQSFSVDENFKPDGRSKEAKTYKKLKQFAGAEVYPLISNHRMTYFLVVYNSDKETYANEYEKYNVADAVAAKTVAAVLIHINEEIVKLCLHKIVQDQNGVDWEMLEWCQERKITPRENRTLITSLVGNGDLVGKILKQIDRHKHNEAMQADHKQKVAEMNNKDPLCNQSLYAIQKAEEFVSQYENNLLDISKMSLREIHQAGVNKVIKELCQIVTYKVGRPYCETGCNRSLRSHRDAYSNTQIDDVLLYIHTTWQGQQWSEYDPFMQEAIKQFSNLITW